MTDFDCYVGLSAGSILAVALGAGVSPNEMVKVLEGTSRRMDMLRPVDFYNPNWREFLERPAKLALRPLRVSARCRLRSAALPAGAAGRGRRAAAPVRERAELRELRSSPRWRCSQHVSPTREIPALTNHIPSGLFDNASLERWLRRNLERMRIPNDFRGFSRKRGCDLYISACDLDTAERETFGPDERNDISISHAVQASHRAAALLQARAHPGRRLRRRRRAPHREHRRRDRQGLRPHHLLQPVPSVPEPHRHRGRRRRRTSRTGAISPTAA